MSCGSSRTDISTTPGTPRPSSPPGAADAVALAEPALANRNWPHRVRAGQVLAPDVPADLFGPAANLKDWELVGAPEEGLPGAQRP